MTLRENLPGKHTMVRPDFLFGLGVHLVGNGLLVLTIYYLVMDISAQGAQEILAWVIPFGYGCCFFGALSLGAALTSRNLTAPVEKQGRWSKWLIRRITPFANGSRAGAAGKSPDTRAPSPAQVEQALQAAQTADWIRFKDLGMDYFREIGFRVLDQPQRACGVDFLLYTETDLDVVAVRCLPRGTKRVDVDQARTFHRAARLAGASLGVVLTTGVIDEEAIEFGHANGVELLGGQEFITRVLLLPPETARNLLSKVETADEN